jgi:ubiquinone biosynthesis protein
MNPVRQALRVAKINVVLLRNGLDEIVLDTHFFRPIKFLLYLTPWYWLRRSRDSRGARIRKSLEQLGPIFVKFGQILSTRQDLLPPDVVAELALLQDRVPPFSSDTARMLIEAALGQRLDAVFAEFDVAPLASASIAQVHAARLQDGREVVVKVVRPAILKTIRQDIELMYTIADLAERYWSTGKRLRPREVVAEFEKNLIDELDLMREAANASQLRRHFADSPLLYVPDVEWSFTKTNVMVMERIRGIPINQIQTLRSLDVDFKTLAERGVEIFFTQVFRNSFFHADMHPGNIFVDASRPAQPRYIAVDFGIMGSLHPMDQNYLAQNFLAFFNRDYRRVAELHVESGWVPPGTRVDEFEAAIRTVCEPIFERPLHEISFGGLLLRLFQTARRFNMVVQPQLVLLQKTLLNIEGLGRQLYPNLDLWATAKPFLERWMSEQVGLRSVGRRLVKNLPVWGQILPELPNTVYQAMQTTQNIQKQLEYQGQELRLLRKQLRRSYHVQSLVLVACAILGGEFLLMVQRGGADGWFNHGNEWLHGGLIVLAVVLLWGARPLHRD